MLQALWSASSGMLAQQTAIDTVANNLANVNTPGFKKNRTEFQDLLYAQLRSPGRTTVTGQVIPHGIRVGNGTRLASTQVLFEQGSLQETGNSTDFAISGDGFFEVLRPDGTKAYTRDGAFKIDADGYLVTGNGDIVNMESKDGGLVTFQEGTGKISIDSSGTIYQEKPLVQLEAYGFTSPQDLEQVEPGIYRPTDKSGEATLIAEMQPEGTEERTDVEGNPIPAPEKAKPRVFYQVMLPDGDTAYTSDSRFKIDENGRLVTVDKGYPLEPEVTVDTVDNGLKAGDVLAVSSDGVISVPAEQGKLVIVRFTNPAGLEKVGTNLYVPTANSGNAMPAGDSKVIQGSLEMANVQVAEEMVNMMIANRAYELNSRCVRTADDMLAMANALLRR